MNMQIYEIGEVKEKRVNLENFGGLKEFLFE